MNKALYQFCQRKFKTQTSGVLPLSSLLTQLHSQYSFGEIKNGQLHFNNKDRQALIERIQGENNLQLFRDNFTSTQTRSKNAVTFRNEKSNSAPVNDGFILVNAINSIHINKQKIAIFPVSSLGHYIKADEIISVEHEFIVLVENLTIMSALSTLILPENLKQALFLYRGDINPKQRTSHAYDFFRHFSETTSLVCFSDLDPEGIQIAITSGAHYWLAPEDFSVINLPLVGHEQEWFAQLSSVKWLKKHDQIAENCQNAFLEMCLSQKTLKQEHMLAHHIKLALYRL